jgi:chemotaxis protein histidine kinase CheA
MNDNTDYSDFPQTCHHLDTRRHSLCEEKDRTASPFAAVFLYSTTGSPCWTESDSLQSSSLESFCTDTILQGVGIDWATLAEEEAEDMAASWSSAATGKPQLSYAERLRRAKEGTSKADLPTTAPPSYADTPASPSNGAALQRPTQKEEEQKAPPMNSESIATPSKSLPQSPPLQNAKSENAGDSAASVVESQSSPKAVVNVWEARKKLLQDREKAKAAVPSQVAASAVKESNESKTAEPTIQPVQEVTKTAKQTVRNDAWSQKGKMVNGGANTKVEERRDTAKGEESKGKKKKGVDSTSKAKNGSTAPPPSIADATAWPSPDASLSGGSKPTAETIKRQDEERVASSSATTANGLQDLDVEVVKRAGPGSPKRGKQWIPIVPTITHTSTLPGTPVKRKQNKAPAVETTSASASPVSPPPATTSTIETRVIPTSPTNYTRRLEQKKPTPINSQIASPSRNDDKSLLQSPGQDLRGLSPRLAQLAINNQSMQNKSSSLAASPRRDYSSSPIRSPSLAGGSVRGPRFSGDLKSPKDAHTWLQPLPNDDSSLDLSIPSGIEGDASSGSRNALRLSDGGIDTPPPHALGLSSQAGTTDGSYAPIRTGASAIPPMMQSLQHEAGLLRANSMNRSLSSTPSPRGSRGRGKTSKTSDGHSVGESSSSRNDIEDRGLPSDVPSGPRRQQNGDGTPPREGGRSYKGGGNFRRGPYYQQQQPMPYGMYPPPPPGSFFYPPPLPQIESTPSEFAPQGDASKSEPSEALLHQIEFYFSHRNLEGDFFLRKNMDSQGFVPIRVVANFKKVKNLTESFDVIKETLLYSKVLFVDTEREMVRKAVDWHLYILIDGERPQQSMYPSPRQPLPHYGSPPPPMPPFAHASPPFVPYYGHPAPPPLYFPSPYNQAGPPQFIAGQDPPHWAQQPFQRHTEPDTSNREASGDNIFGVIAAEGLAAERRPE